MDIELKTNISEQKFGVQNTNKKIASNRYEPKIALEDKMYLETHYDCQLGSVAMDETLTKIKAHELQITRWTLTEDQ